MSATASTDIVKVDDGQTTEIAIDAPSSPDPNMKLALPPSGFTSVDALKTALAAAPDPLAGLSDLTRDERGLNRSA